MYPSLHCPKSIDSFCETTADVPAQQNAPTSLDPPRSDAVSIPPPLKFHPTRARRQFAARLAERQRRQEEAEGSDRPSDPFADPEEGEEGEDEGSAEQQSGRTEHFSSDDSIEGEEGGIVMRKAVRQGGTAGFVSLGGVGREEGVENEKAVGEIRDVFERLGIDVGEIGRVESEGLGLGVEGMFGARDRESDEDVEQHSSEEEIEDEGEDER